MSQPALPLATPRTSEVLKAGALGGAALGVRAVGAGRRCLAGGTIDIDIVTINNMYTSYKAVCLQP